MWSTRRPEVLADLDTLLRLVGELSVTPDGADPRDRAVALAHRLHGALGVFGFSGVRSLMAEVEAALRGQDTRDVAAILAEVRRTLP